MKYDGRELISRYLLLLTQGVQTLPNKRSDFALSVGVVRRICEIAGARTIVDDNRVGLARQGVITAVQRHDTPAIFDWLLTAVSYQGVSDHIAYGYMERHGNVHWHDIAEALASKPSCPKLTCYWAFEGCGYRKGSGLCTIPEHQAECSLPQHDLRNGRLNQTAYSLFLFIRDLANGDLVGWIDERLAGADIIPVSDDRPERLRQALLPPLANIYGVSNKVLSMSLSDLLLAGDAKRQIWVEAGAVMIAIDTLVHNFLHRTGILRQLGADHAYGPGCYRPDGCAVILERIAAKIDARRLNPSYPAFFPRFVQHAIWRFCAEVGLDRCNGNRIDDRAPCEQTDCPVFENALACPCGRYQQRLTHNSLIIRATTNSLLSHCVPDMFCNAGNAICEFAASHSTLLEFQKWATRYRLSWFLVSMCSTSRTPRDLTCAI